MYKDDPNCIDIDQALESQKLTTMSNQKQFLELLQTMMQLRNYNEEAIQEFLSDQNSSH